MKDKQSKQYLYIISISIDKLCINTEDASRERKRELKTRRRMGSEKG